MLMLFLIFAAISLYSQLLIIDLRYIWFLDERESMSITLIHVISVVFVILLWSFFPSRILVMLAAFAGYLLPPLIDSDAFVTIDFGFMLYVLPSLLLFYLATELRRRIKPTSSGAKQ